MKIKLTREELVAILSKHFDSKIDGIIIESPINARARKMVKICRDIERKYPALAINIDHKIPAIRTLREEFLKLGFNIGLADAKRSVESMGEFKDYIKKYKKPPFEPYRP